MAQPLCRVCNLRERYPKHAKCSLCLAARRKELYKENHEVYRSRRNTYYANRRATDETFRQISNAKRNEYRVRKRVDDETYRPKLSAQKRARYWRRIACDETYREKLNAQKRASYWRSKGLDTPPAIRPTMAAQSVKPKTKKAPKVANAPTIAPNTSEPQETTKEAPENTIPSEPEPEPGDLGFNYTELLLDP